MNKIFEQKKKDANDREPGLRKTKYNGLDEIPIKTIDPHVESVEKVPIFLQNRFFLLIL
jgi:hypothetical protein